MDAPVINPQFDDASRKFSEGLIAVELEKKWGYIDKAGKIVINPQFDYANSEFIDGLAQVNIGDKSGYINRDGKYIWNPTN
ncbi:MAG: WG repeat-containing protein [Nostoc sp.]|uniref:WG repeat-containing protein n=1 Tax=Nostoc sp. TaxID=1180 RepID=UPI002FF32F95